MNDSAGTSVVYRSLALPGAEAQERGSAAEFFVELPGLEGDGEPCVLGSSSREDDRCVGIDNASLSRAEQQS